ncbi:MAG: hypothetical protein JOY96_07205 [Verrucomicrobia bacterium]|nr:hypothetical protein [Verrucomicrobiota bacterium]
MTVGDFLIGYDPTRNAGSDSGFFLKDTLNNLALFDLSQPTVAISTATDTLRLSDVNLLVAPGVGRFSFETDADRS